VLIISTIAILKIQLWQSLTNYCNTETINISKSGSEIYVISIRKGVEIIKAIIILQQKILKNTTCFM